MYSVCKLCSTYVLTIMRWHTLSTHSCRKNASRSSVRRAFANENDEENGVCRQHGSSDPSPQWWPTSAPHPDDVAIDIFPLNNIIINNKNNRIITMVHNVISTSNHHIRRRLEGCRICTFKTHRTAITSRTASPSSFIIDDETTTSTTSSIIG
jgi:hypothetical protein